MILSGALEGTGELRLSSGTSRLLVLNEMKKRRDT